MRKVLVVTSTRADFGILSNLTKLLEKDKSIDMSLVVTGSHLIKSKNSSFTEIKRQKLKSKKILKIQIKNENLGDTLNIFSKSIVKFKKTYEKIRPDLVLILGDRFEIFASALSAFFYRIPIAHIHGGEVTSGAMDDSIRHSITKISNLHFVTNKENYKRVNQLGENNKNIFLVGSLSSENIKKSKFLKKKELEKKFNIKFKNKNLLITYHPVTLQKDFGKKDFKKMLNVLKKYNEFGIFFTASNADVANNFFNKEIKNFVKKNKNTYLIESFGRENYFSMLRIVDCIIGNSSSGVLESTAFKLPAINIGSRQEGRVKNKNILNLKSEFKENELKKKISQSISVKFNKGLKDLRDKNYRGNTSKKIFKIIKNFKYEDIKKKSFYDIKF